ncbi:hypothetical protein Q4Q39_03775 [Flavivirga amylovorans]|uniref:Uncharacterized protein n=1 Tax=Flavivirga amylovorans TaxID=870486 RepID=A0ABT8WXY7_9FLAO|nr:hypothetical protein [Flavivirga amylovorans]
MEKKINLFKFIAIILFIFIPIPSEKFHIVNGLSIIALLLILINEMNFNSLIMPFIAFSSILMMFFENIKVSIIGFILCNIYLIYIIIINSRAIHDNLFLILAFIFFLISIYTIKLMIKRGEKH